jgi:hypothetical protein
LNSSRSSLLTRHRRRVFTHERAFARQAHHHETQSIFVQFATAYAALLFSANSAVAGPPLLCHAFDIGNAKSLPWISHDWNLTGRETYDVNNLIADTIAILDTDPTVLVHMETLRRATLYSQIDPLSAKRLLNKLMARSESAAQNSPAAALSLFDLGYFAKSLEQFQWVHKEASKPAQGLDGYALVSKAIQLRGNDAQMEFAAAIIALNAGASERQDHAQKAIAGAKNDPLLAKNLSAHFPDAQSGTVAEMILRTANVKVVHQ